MSDSRAVMFHQGALGDFLTAASVIDELAADSAWDCIDFWSKPELASLLTGKSYLGKCHSADSPLISYLLHDSLWRKAALPDFLLNADHLFIFGQSGSRIMAERLSARLSAKVYWIQSFPLRAGQGSEVRGRRSLLSPRRPDPSKSRASRDCGGRLSVLSAPTPPNPALRGTAGAGSCASHVSDFLRMQLNDLGWPVRGRPLTLSPPASEKQAAAELLRSLTTHHSSFIIFIHPGSGSRSKVWPLRNWHGLLDWLRHSVGDHTSADAGKRLSPAECRTQALLSIGPADEYMSEFCVAMREAGVPIVSGLSPLRLAGLFSLCDLYIGGDSGVSHLAAGVGTPAICVFGPTDPDVWAPRGKNAVVVRRRWKESDVFDWSPYKKPDFQDEEIIKLIRHYLSNAPSTHTTHSA